jgi:hypothetical protein
VSGASTGSRDGARARGQIDGRVNLGCRLGSGSPTGGAPSGEPDETPCRAPRGPGLGACHRLSMLPRRSRQSTGKAPLTQFAARIVATAPPNGTFSGGRSAPFGCSWLKSAQVGSCRLGRGSRKLGDRTSAKSGRTGSLERTTLRHLPHRTSEDIRRTPDADFAPRGVHASRCGVEMACGLRISTERAASPSWPRPPAGASHGGPLESRASPARVPHSGNQTP